MQNSLYTRRVTSLTDTHHSSRAGWEVLGLCCVIAMLDGYDTQVIAFSAPALADHFRIPLPMFGFIFSAGLAGSMLGSAFAGRLADSYGRRRLMIAAVALFGAATLMTAIAASVGAFVTLRAVTGLGLGGALPNFISMAAEHAPVHMRTRFVAMTLWGFPIGAVVGGLLSMPLIERIGPQSVFIAGGAAPLLLVPLLYARLPESNDWQRAAETKLSPATREQGTTWVATEVRQPDQIGFRGIFGKEYRRTTLSLACSLSMCLLLSYLLVTWIPLLLRMAGLGKKIAVGGAIAMNLGGIIGSYGFTRLIDSSVRPLPLITGALCASSITVALIGATTTSGWSVLSSILVTGILLIGGQMTLSSYTSAVFPVQLRATAVGFIQATGRFGALLGPLVASLLLSLGLPVSTLLRLAGLAGLIAAATLVPLRSDEGVSRAGEE